MPEVAEIASSFPRDLRVALVHDWLTGMRGGEKCLEVFCEIFPQADIFTLLHVPGAVSASIARHRIVTAGRIQHLPAAARIYRWALPLMPSAVESFDLGGYDLVLSSSHCVAKSARPAPGALSVCYCHTPMRYVWDRFDDYFGRKPQPLRWLIARQAAWLRAWDRRTAHRVNLWLANSTCVRQRIVDYYDVAPPHIAVIAPPVDVDMFLGDATTLLPPPGLASGSYDLVVSALVPYKRIDIAVRAACMARRPLVVVGKGSEAARLRALGAEGPVTFLGAVATPQLPSLYAHARSFVFPGHEDFGITPLEATACGTPVVAYGAGGVFDTVREGLNGIFFPEQTATSLAAALDDPRLDEPWDRVAMRRHAEAFGRQRFREEIASRLRQAWAQHRPREARHG